MRRCLGEAKATTVEARGKPPVLDATSARGPAETQRGPLGLLSEMESTSRLRTILSNATSPRASSQVEQELFEELVALKPLLVKILDFGPRRPEEQKEIESGKFYLVQEASVLW
jgi:hypothetical protein